MRPLGRTAFTLAGAAAALLAATVFLPLTSTYSRVRAQTTNAGVVRPWTCWTLSIAEQSILPPVVSAETCAGARPTSIRFGPRVTSRSALPIVVPAAPSSLSALVSGRRWS